MKKTISLIVAVICIILMLNSCGLKIVCNTFETELGDTFCLEVSLRGNLHGLYPRYLIYDGDKDIKKENGCILYVDRTIEGCLPNNPQSNITAVGSYGDHNYYKIFDTLFYYNKGVYMDLIPEHFDVEDYEYYKKSPQIPDFILYRVKAISDLMKSQNFDYVYKYSGILAYDKDPYLHEILIRYANGDFTDDEKQINIDSIISATDMTSFAQNMLEKHYT